MAVFGLLAVRRLRTAYGWGPGSVLVELSVVEQRYRAVLAVLSGESVVSVAAQVGVSRQSVHTWLRRYEAEGLGGLGPLETTGVLSAPVSDRARRGDL